MTSSERPAPQAETASGQPGDFASTNESAPALKAAVETPDPAPGVSPKQMTAAVFAALVGRDLSTLRNWDKAGLTHPEMRRSRRYYGADDLAAVLANGTGRKGAREGSLINYMDLRWDNGP